MNKTIVMLTGLAALAGGFGCARTHRPENAVEMNLPEGAPKLPEGIPALAVKPGPAPFTKEDVTQYVQANALANSAGDTSTLHVESLEFTTAREVTARLQGVSTGLPDDHRVAFAIIQGPIYFTGPPRSKPVAFDTAYALFDAATGNLLMSGTLTKSKDQPQRDKERSTGNQHN